MVPHYAMWSMTGVQGQVNRPEALLCTPMCGSWGCPVPTFQCSVKHNTHAQPTHCTSLSCNTVLDLRASSVLWNEPIPVLIHGDHLHDKVVLLNTLRNAVHKVGTCGVMQGQVVHSVTPHTHTRARVRTHTHTHTRMHACIQTHRQTQLQ